MATEAPSIWFLPHLKALATCPAVRKHTFRQSIHGQYAHKKATLLVLRLETLGQYIYRPQVSELEMKLFRQGQMFQTLTGKNEQGQWKTHGAKEYTSSMCRAISLACIDSLKVAAHRNKGKCQDLDVQSRSVLQKLFVPYDPYMNDHAEIGADCKLFCSVPNEMTTPTLHGFIVNSATHSANQ